MADGRRRGAVTAGAAPLRPDFADVPPVRRRNMAAIRGRDTAPELVLRRLLHAAGYRYRLHVAGLPGRPDLVFAARRCIVDVRGCFWHRHGCANSVLPAARRDWWAAKLAATVARDARNAAALAAAGWRVCVVWECALRADPGAAARRVRRFLGAPALSLDYSRSRSGIGRPGRSGTFRTSATARTV